MVQGLKASRKQAPSAPSHEVVHKPTGPVSTTTESISDSKEEGTKHRKPNHNEQLVRELLAEGTPRTAFDLYQRARSRGLATLQEQINRACNAMLKTGEIEVAAGFARPAGRDGSMTRAFRLTTPEK